jgi:hypothetical protein
MNERGVRDCQESRGHGKISPKMACLDIRKEGTLVRGRMLVRLSREKVSTKPEPSYVLL